MLLGVLHCVASVSVYLPRAVIVIIKSLISIITGISWRAVLTSTCIFLVHPHDPVRKKAITTLTLLIGKRGAYMTCPRSNSEWEHPESGLRPSDFRAWGRDHSSIFPRLPSDWLWEILRQTGAAGSVEGINIPWINWKDPATPRGRPWGAGPSGQRPTRTYSRTGPASLFALKHNWRGSPCTFLSHVPVVFPQFTYKLILPKTLDSTLKMSLPAELQWALAGLRLNSTATVLPWK